MTSASNATTPRRPAKQKQEEKHRGGAGEEGEKRLKFEDQPRCEWDFHLSAVIVPAGPHTTSDALGAIEFDPSHRLLATAGIARKIRIYSLPSLLPPEDHHPTTTTTRFLDPADSCDFFICAPAKLSSVRFRPDSAGAIIGAGDYDGVVTEYDLERRIAVFERDEHGGRRVWSVAYSRTSPSLGSSGSDDGTAHLWDARSGARAGVIRPSTRGDAPVCSVEFDPAGGAGFGVGCADRSAYVYDARALSAGPVAELRGHARAVTFVRFVGDNKIVTSAADGSHRLWGASDGKEVRVYRGHANARSFVGMSVWREGGLIGSGSESNEVYVYDLRWGEPVWVEEFGFGSAGEADGLDRGFVSSVCWKDGGGDADHGILVAGGSNGVLKLFLGTRKPLVLDRW